MNAFPVAGTVLYFSYSVRHSKERLLEQKERHTAMGHTIAHADADLALGSPGSPQDLEAAPRSNGTNGIGNPALDLDASTKF